MKFADRHIGPRSSDVETMLSVVAADSLESLISETVPDEIRFNAPLELPDAMSETEALVQISNYAKQNEAWKCYLGQGYYPCIVPSVIQRTILENPCWYTQYTPYQAEIAQGRLEALLNFQTLVSDLTGMEISNSSLLDEGTAVAEALGLMLRQSRGSRDPIVCVHESLFPQSIEVLQTRAKWFGVEIKIVTNLDDVRSCSENILGLFIQSPDTDGSVHQLEDWIQLAHEKGALVSVATDLLALCLLESPGSLGADMVVGSAQRFGVPMGFGGPHAAFLATRKEYQRNLPGRLVGVSKDRNGKLAYRLALQTREQHIKRERATSNICTAQVLLAIMSSMYAVYHGPKGLKDIATSVNKRTRQLSYLLSTAGITLKDTETFDTLTLLKLTDVTHIKDRAMKHKVNLRYVDDATISVSISENTTDEDVLELYEILSGKKETKLPQDVHVLSSRKEEILTNKVFNSYHSETLLLRYITRLQNRDLSLAHSMIPLGSCTMKLNAASEMLPVTWPEFASLHPFAPRSQTRGSLRMIKDLEEYLSEITALPAVSLQPNAGSQGEYAGLLAIRNFFEQEGETKRNICLIPSSAHGTNPASAHMAGLDVKVVACDEQGNVDIEDLKSKVEQYKDTLCALMITYPSTHGVFESTIKEICSIVHSAGAKVYMDGANMNAQVGLCRPGDFGIDVLHLNLHKTFCIPHGGGGPGVGPIAATSELSSHMPGHEHYNLEGSGAVSAAPYGSAGILQIPWMYIRMMGADGLKKATEVAILNANYIANKLSDYFPILYRGENNRVAHECIIDLRAVKKEAGVTVADVAKRLIDYGFHAPTVSFPVADTMMIEPTESEDLEELDRFCDAMISIHGEIMAIKEGRVKLEESTLRLSPHTSVEMCSAEWARPYSREVAAYPLEWVSERKFWPYVSRIDDAYGDRNLTCVCPSTEEYAD